MLLKTVHAKPHSQAGHAFPELPCFSKAFPSGYGKASRIKLVDSMIR